MRLHDTVRALVDKYHELKTFHTEMYTTLVAMRTNIQKARLSKENMTDCAFVLREMSKLLNDIRKEIDSAQQMAERSVCLVWIVETQNDFDNSQPVVRGDLSTGSPDVRQMASLPHPTRNPEDWEALCSYLGINETARTFFRLHFPTMAEHVTELTAAGKPLPPGIHPETTYPVYRLQPLRKRRGVELDEV